MLRTNALTGLAKSVYGRRSGKIFTLTREKGARVTKPPNSDYRLGPALLVLAAGRLIVLIAHSHSESQFLPHLPKHSKSIMCPPHCGQTRLMIEEIMLAFASPGIVSMRLIVPSSSHCKILPESSPSFEKARRSPGPRTTVNLPRVSVAFKRSVLVGYGVRPGHLYRLPPRSVHDLANAMPMSDTLMLQSHVPRVRPLASFWRLTDCHAVCGQDPRGPGEESPGINGLKIYLLSKS
jgi:hypothetical protein